MLFNPVVALLFNQKLNRWHPIWYDESPLPGPPSDSKPTRHKSLGHHTAGFDTREAAIQEVKSTSDKVIAAKDATTVAVAFDEDLAWDGEDVPADVAFFAIDGTTARRIM